MELRTNLQYLKKSNKAPRPGDVFVLRPPTDRYLFGRVIGVDLQFPKAPMSGAMLVYIYSVEREDKQPPLDELTPDRLLVPPIYTNKKGWTVGIFETVLHRELERADELERYCFWDGLRKKYVNEEREVLPQRFEPCGTWGLVSYRMLDDMVSDALGIERAPEHPNDNRND